MPDSLVLTTAEAAAMLGIDKDSVSRLIRRGKLKAEKPGHDWLVLRESLLDRLSEKEREQKKS